MKKALKQFFEFNGRPIYFILKDDGYWIAIRPICEALGLGYAAQYKSVKKHPFYAQLLSLQTMVDSKNALRKMVALPEEVIYGWLFQLRSSNPDLMKYQFEINKILFNLLRGNMPNREVLLTEKAMLQKEDAEIEIRLSQNEDHRRKKEIKKSLRSIDHHLHSIDRKAIEEKQLSLFN